MNAGLYDYANLDARDADRAIFRMEARAVDPASAALFEALVAPVVDGLDRGAQVLEVGGGTGALARRILDRRPDVRVHSTDRSVAMTEAARRYAEGAPPGLSFAAASASDAVRAGTWDLVVSSVMIPYLDDGAVEDLVGAIAAHLTPGGRALFVEQDLASDALYHPEPALVGKVLAKEARAIPAHAALGLRPRLRGAGLTVAPTASALWQTTTFGPYLRDLLGRAAADAMRERRLLADEAARFHGGLAEADRAGDFHYALLYHRVLATRP